VDTLILDRVDPEEARTPPMAMKDYADEFKADAVALYESTPGATYKDIASDLGINRATLRAWVLRDRDRRGIVPLSSAVRGHAWVCRAVSMQVTVLPVVLGQGNAWAHVF
jgi:transposase-like protein